MGNVHMEATQINYRGGSKKMSVEEAIKAAGTEITPEEKTWIDSIPALTTSNAGKTDQTVIAPEFDAEAGVYSVGDLVMHEGKLYEFTSAHETAGDWNSEEVSEKTVADEIGDVKSGLNDLIKITNTPLDNSTLAPGAFKADACTLSIPTGYTLVGFYVVTTGAYTSYCTFYTSVAGVVQATNTHQTETAELTGVVVALFLKTAFLN